MRLVTKVTIKIFNNWDGQGVGAGGGSPKWEPTPKSDQSRGFEGPEETKLSSVRKLELVLN